jgi:hypothetical protein
MSLEVSVFFATLHENDSIDLWIISRTLDKINNELSTFKGILGFGSVCENFSTLYLDVNELIIGDASGCKLIEDI